MTLQQLRHFLAVIEAGSLRAAARELGLSQAGLTNSLQALEASVGTTLLARSGSGVALNAAGRKLATRARLIDREAQRALEELQPGRGASGGALRGTLRVGLGPTPTAALLPLVVPDFHARHPQVRLRLEGGFHEKLRPALLEGAIELAITAVPDDDAGPSLVRRVLFRSNLVVLARRGHPHLAARSLAELDGCEWILMGTPGGPGGTVTRYHAEHGLPPPRVAATCDSFTQLSALISGTDWLALLPAVLIERGLLGRDVVALRLKEAAPRFDNCVLYRHEPPLTPAAAAFAAMCESAARIVAGSGLRQGFHEPNLS